MYQTKQNSLLTYMTPSQIRAAWTRIQLRNAHPTSEVRRRLADARKRAEQTTRRAA